MPVRRVSRRYLGFRVISDRRFSEQEIGDAIQKSVLYLYGVTGLSRVSPTLIEFDEDRQGGILRCSHESLRSMRASLAHMTCIGDSQASICVERVSGTIKGLKRGL